METKYDKNINSLRDQLTFNRTFEFTLEHSIALLNSMQLTSKGLRGIVEPSSFLFSNDRDRLIYMLNHARLYSDTIDFKLTELIRIRQTSLNIKRSINNG